MQKSRRSFGDFIDSRLKRSFVSLRWFAEAADFPHELQRGIPNFFRCHRRIKVEQNSDVPAHGDHLKTSQSAIIGHPPPPAIPNNLVSPITPCNQMRQPKTTPRNLSKPWTADNQFHFL